TTPTIDRLAAEGIVFERFHAASPWTGASFGSILTGVSPTVHGAGRREKEGSKTARSILGVTITPMSERVPTVAELLGEINSAAIVTNSFLIESMGFARGFDHYDQQFAGLIKSRPADETTKAAIAWLEKNQQQPFFLMVHYFDPHMSYKPPKEYLERFAPGAGRVSGPFYDHRRARAGKLDLKQNEKEQIRRVYNGEVRFVDDQIGELVAALERLGVLDDTWLMITADHGEEQFDHGSFDHGHRYEEEVTRVPLVIRPPDGKWHAGTRVPYSTRHIDLAPTILDWMGRDPAPSMAGQSLMGLITGDETAHRPAYVEFNIYWTQRCALYDGRYKLIRATDSNNGWLYDLEADPLEQNKLDRAHPQYAALEKQLDAVRKQLEQLAADARKDTKTIELSPEVVESLRSLGYID
ncbi:MAG: sulfatase, partial [Deltaproteobacteria bacterium]|nr:sulfatase [Deltaproteobacteria bacterium]